jgi:hypothetical protein
VAGRAVSVDEAIADALAVTALAPSSPTSIREDLGLTERELDVL